MKSNSPDYNCNDPQGWGGDPSRGAAIGRDSICEIDTSYSGYLYIHEVEVGDDGYDPNGTYFGIGEPLFWCVARYAHDDSFILDHSVRAASMDAAVQLMKQKFPLASIRCAKRIQ